MSSIEPRSSPADTSLSWVVGLAVTAGLSAAAFATPPLVPVVAAMWLFGGIMAFLRGPSKGWKVLGIVGITGGVIIIAALVGLTVLAIFGDVTGVTEGPGE